MLMAKNIHPINTVLFTFLLLVLVMINPKNTVTFFNQSSSKFMINYFELQKENLPRVTVSLQGTCSEESYDKAV